MTTALQLITDAFSMCGILSAETPLNSSQSADGLRIMNNILKRWNVTGKLIGVPTVAAVSDTIKCPDYAESAIITAIAVRLCGEYGIDVTPSLATDTNESFEDMIIASINFSQMKPPSTLPRGSGNRRLSSGYAENIFSDKTDQENF
jgi:hypothetical protein